MSGKRSDQLRRFVVDKQADPAAWPAARAAAGEINAAALAFAKRVGFDIAAAHLANLSAAMKQALRRRPPKRLGSVGRASRFVDSDIHWKSVLLSPPLDHRGRPLSVMALARSARQNELRFTRVSLDAVRRHFSRLKREAMAERRGQCDWASGHTNALLVLLGGQPPLK